jgi:hypothetical protein
MYHSGSRGPNFDNKSRRGSHGARVAYSLLTSSGCGVGSVSAVGGVCWARKMSESKEFANERGLTSSRVQVCVSKICDISVYGAYFFYGACQIANFTF